MVEGLNINKQFTLVNAPAGSGKTTALSKTVNKLLQTPQKRILCITYTNRAANQLIEKIDNDKVEVSTIHSFISKFMRPFFKIEPVIEYFVEFYENDIRSLLGSDDERDRIKLQRFKDKFNLEEDCEVTLQTIKENISELEYGETQFTSVLYGRLSHDDLLIFANKVCHEFPKLSKVISQRYSYIFIDEYQDTQSEVLELFYHSCIGSETKLILLGDEMQQIYNERVEGFQSIIEDNFVRNYSLKFNWRSQGNIVKLLNNLYFDSSYQQIPKIMDEEKPKLYIVDDLGTEISEGNLQLVLYNSDLFKAIGAYNLYVAYNERYKLFDKHNTKEILLDMSMDNPDDLIVLLIFITNISDLFDNKQYNRIIGEIRNYKFSNKEIWKIKNHKDKIKIAQYLNQLSNELKKDLTIEELLNFLRGNEIIYKSHIDMIISQIDENEEFKNKINSVKFEEFIHCYIESKSPEFSTQHAVKGEGYDNVALKISDGNNPNVKMYFFLDLISRDLFDYLELTSMQKEINENINALSETTMKRISEIKAADYKNSEKQCEVCYLNIKKVLVNNEELFNAFFVDIFSKYEEKPNLSNFLKCIRLVRRIEGALLAYKLFYVGCSRAKRKLSVYVEKSNIHSFEQEFISKMVNLNFEVVT
ncbi:UvrD-helicase domain-containing protein [Sporosarcina sp. SAFN-015]|uniref:UvrD-helicase domain-containing protein n=1 Tax=Sporosarcina sp. SAFN-015 TaxID=3387274 RepID=UPI003F814230